MPDALVLPGPYADSCGTPYAATKHSKTGWWLQKLSYMPFDGPAPAAFQYPDFEAAVNTGRFTPISTHA